MSTKREEAQKRRAEDRRKRRADASDEPKQDDAGSEEPLETVKHAAKVAAAAAAVGAAVGAARAMTGAGEDGNEPGRAPEPVAEHEQPEESEEPEEPEQPEQHEEVEQPEQPEEPEPPRAQQEEPSEEAHERPSGASPSEARRVVEAAREQLAVLLGKQADAVSGLERTDGGWIVTLDVVELARIPESTDVLASYELELDGDRNLVRYRRGRRFYRSEADDGELP
jgi:gas vesicle protein GvpO